MIISMTLYGRMTYLILWGLVYYQDIAFIKSEPGMIHAGCGLMLMLLFCKLFTKDLALKFIGGAVSLILAGVALGYFAGPKNIIYFAADPNTANYPYNNTNCFNYH